MVEGQFAFTILADSMSFILPCERNNFLLYLAQRYKSYYIATHIIYKKNIVTHV